MGIPELVKIKSKGEREEPGATMVVGFIINR